MLLGKGVLKICSKFTGEHPCRSVISMQFSWNHFSAYVFSCKLAAYFQNIFLTDTFYGLLLKSHNDFPYQNGNDGLSLSKNILTADIFISCYYVILTHFIKEMGGGLFGIVQKNKNVSLTIQYLKTVCTRWKWIFSFIT